MRVFDKKVKGYTIIEMMMVMGIIALLSVIGVTGLISARHRGRVDETTQGIVTTIRQVQNKTIAVEQRDNTKAWGVRITATPTNLTDPGSYQMISYDLLEGDTELTLNDEISGETPLCSETNSNCQSITKIKITKYDTTNFSDGQILESVVIAYSTPFAKPYIILSNDGCGETSTFCSWIDPLNPAQDWEPSTALSPNIYFSDYTSQPNRSVKIEVTYQQDIRNIWVKANGDVYIE